MCWVVTVSSALPSGGPSPAQTPLPGQIGLGDGKQVLTEGLAEPLPEPGHRAWDSTEPRHPPTLGPHFLPRQDTVFTNVMEAPQKVS